MSEARFSSNNVESIDRARERRPIRMHQVRLVLVLDRSASMKPHEALVIEKLRDFFLELRRNLPAGTECLVTMSQFSD
jgi:hypothetical protein